MAVVYLALTLMYLVAQVAGMGCPHSSERLGQKCFQFVDNAVNFESARKNCKGLGGMLARIDNEQENSFIKGLIKHTAWIGLNDRTTEGSFVYADSPARATYTKWALGEPNNLNWFGNTQDCVKMYGWGLAKGAWDDDYCNVNKAYVCQFGLVSDSRTRCPVGTHPHGNNCYEVVTSPMKWSDALSHCRKILGGGTLAAIMNKAEDDFVFGLMGGKDTWIGLNDRAREGTFRWADRSGSPPYLNFAFGEPNNLFWSEDCVNIYGGGFLIPVRKWNDANCNSKKQFVCQIGAKAEVTPAPITAAPTPAPRCSWKSYQNSYIAMNNKKEVKVNSEAECKKLCEHETEFKCMSLDYQKSKKHCNLAEMSYAEAQRGNLLRKSNDFTLYAC